MIFIHKIIFEIIVFLIHSILILKLSIVLIININEKNMQYRIFLLCFLNVFFLESVSKINLSDLNFVFDDKIETTRFKVLNKTKETLGELIVSKLNSDTFQILLLHVKDMFRSAGIGKTMMKNFIKIVKDQGAKKITVDAFPHMVNFYKKFNFKLTGKNNGGHPVMELVLKK